MDQKIELKLGFKIKEKPTWFEKSSYIKSIFPSLKIMKPGYDLYGTTTLVLAILAVFVLYGFDSVMVSQADILKDAGK